MKKTVFFLLALLSSALSWQAMGQINPIEATGYNADIVANGVGPMVNSTNNSADNSGFCFISKDWKLNAGDSDRTLGLPNNGIIISPDIAGLTYQIPSVATPYSVNNSLRIDNTSPSYSGSLTVTTPASYSKLYFLVVSGDGSSVVNVTVNFLDGSTQSFNNLSVTDWFYTGLPVELSGFGRGSRSDNTIQSPVDNPKLFRLEVNIDAANQSKFVESITFTKTNTQDNSVINVMAISGENPDNILYVNKTATGTATGNSWANALPELADALVYAKNNESSWTTTPLKIWVAGGTYKPLYSPEDGNFGNPDGRNNSFLMVKNVQLYGGFAGTETTLAQRDLSISANETILSGDVNGDDVVSGSGSTLSITNNTDNNYHVVVSSGDVGNAKLDGLSLIGGNADGTSTSTVNSMPLERNSGGGMNNYNSSPSLANVSLSGNSANYIGGGMYNYDSSPSLTNVSFSGNSATYDGGGMYNDSSSPSLTNVSFSGNFAESFGGGMCNEFSSPSLTNVSFSGNSAFVGGGMCNEFSSPSLTNVSFSGNSAAYYGGGMYNFEDSFPSLTNCILWGNTASYGNGIYPYLFTQISYSLVQDFSDTGNNNLDGTNHNNAPQFTDAVNGDLSLQEGSPAINAGSNQGYTDAGGNLTNDVDLAGNPRLYDGIPDPNVIDMGAYEFQGEPAPIAPDANNILYVSKTATGNGRGNSWVNALPELADALKYAKEQDNYTAANPLKIYVAAGTYKPLYNPADNSFGNNAGALNSFLMVKNVQLYGGFAGTETTLEERNWATNVTILSGDLDNSGTLNTTDVEHIVIASGDVETARLDGFTLTGGRAYGSSYAVVNGYNIANIKGAAIHIYRSSLLLINLRITNNIAADNGAGIHNFKGSPTLVNVEISNNTAEYGAGVFSESPDGENKQITFVNTTITKNHATMNGGGVNNKYGITAIFKNTVLYGNTAVGDLPNIRNEASATSTFTYSNIESNSGWQTAFGTDNGNNIYGDPQFTDFANGDYGLLATSPVINAGNNQAYIDANGDITNDVDLAGNPRLSDATIDMGAYEFQGEPVTPDVNNILYVSKTATGTANGDSWANALPELADALKYAKLQNNYTTSNPLQIWVAGGTYKPMYSPADNNFGYADGRSNSFLLVKNVQLYGGFAGTETTLADRDLSISANETVLSGDVNGDDVVSGSGSTLSITNNTDNNYHVVVSSGDVGNAKLDGFSLIGGNAYDSGYIYINSNSFDSEYGGGIYNNSSSPSLTNVSLSGNFARYGGGMHNYHSSPSLTNVSFSGNSAGRGGGMYNNASSSPSLTNVSFSGNFAESFGGGMFNYSSSSPSLTNVSFSGNSAFNYGGGMYNYYSSPSLTNVSFSGNSATYGGGMYNNTSSPSLTNVSFSGNSAVNYGGGMYNYNSSSPNLTNCILWGNTATLYGNGIYNGGSTPTISYSLVQDIDNTANNGLDGTDVNNDPQFTDATNGDLSLQANSPAINAGSNQGYINAGGDLTNDVDLAGNPRLSDVTIDMGAYEFQGEPGIDYVYEDGSWTPLDPQGNATPEDNIWVINGSTNLTQALEINNATVMSGATLNVEDVLTIHGDITNNGNLIFKSTATKNGELAQVPATSTITGAITVERYMKDKRSYRMVSPAVTTSTTIHDNWQEGATSNIDNPNLGFGTHITGTTVDQTNGFDATNTGRSSMFTVDIAAQMFEAIDNTNFNTLTAGEPYLLFVRGDRSIDLMNDFAAGETVLRATGSLVTGTQIQDYATSNEDDLVMFGNPYQSAVDVNAVFAASTNLNTDHYYVYDSELGAHGSYVTVILPGGTNTSESVANQYLQPGQGAQAITLTAGASSVVFNETDKAPGVGNFTNTSRNPMLVNDMLTVQLYTTENFNNGGSVHDSFGIVFAEGNDNGLTAVDALKPMNFYENLGIDHDGTYLSLEQRDMPEAGEVYALYSTGYQQSDYTLKLIVDGLEASTLYLQDHFTEISTLLDAGENIYSFTVDANNPLSKATNRFTIQTEQRLGVDNNSLLAGIRLYPNPLNADTFYINAPRLNGEQLSVSISDLTGRSIYEQTLECRANTVTVPMGSNIASGVYLVTLKHGGEANTFRLVKE